MRNSPVGPTAMWGMTRTSLNREWHIPINSTNFGVGEAPSAVLLAQEGF